LKRVVVSVDGRVVMDRSIENALRRLHTEVTGQTQEPAAE
jgi:hypothetical protein